MTAADRTTAVWALLSSFADWMPTPVRVWTPSGAIRGESPGRRELCETCEGTGRVGRGACRRCSGRGYHWIDPQSEQEVVSEETTYAQLIQYTRVRCDGCGGSGRLTASTSRDPGLRDLLEVDGERHWWRQAERPRCGHCRGSGSIEVVDDHLMERKLWELAREEAARAGEIVSEDLLDLRARREQEHWSGGSYRELASVLRQFELRAPRLHAALMRHVVWEPGVYTVGPALQQRIEYAVEWIAERMPDPIRVPSEVKTAHARKHVLWRHRSPAAEHARRKRDAEIAALVLDHGQAPERVAEIHAVSAKRVRQIVSSAMAAQPEHPSAVATFAL